METKYQVDDVKKKKNLTQAVNTIWAAKRSRNIYEPVTVASYDLVTLLLMQLTFTISRSVAGLCCVLGDDSRH